MPRNTQKIQERFDARVKDWEKSLAAISRKLTRRLDRERLTYSLKYRIKSLESFLDKLRQQENSVGRTKEKVKDLLGVRITVPFLEDVETVLNVIKSRFEVLETEQKADKLSSREFAYSSVHVIIVIPHANEIELPSGCLNGCEVQIRTILQDAWAEVEHELVYKSSEYFPDNSMGKKLAALNASLTLSDIIFQELRDHQQQLRRWGSDRFHELRKKAAFPNAADLPDEVAEPRSAKSPSRAHTEQNGGEGLQESTLRMALKAHNEKDYPNAIRLYTQTLEEGPGITVRAFIYNHRGMARFMLQHERTALTDFEKSIQCDAQYYHALNNRALVRRRWGQVRESLEDFAQSLQIKSGQPEVHFMRSQTFLEIEEFTSALQAVKAALAIDPNYPEAEKLKNRIQRILAKEKS